MRRKSGRVSRFSLRSKSAFQEAIPSFMIQVKIQLSVSRYSFQVSRFTQRARSGFQDAITSFKIHTKIQFRVSRCNSKFQDSQQDPGQGFKFQFPSFKIQSKIQVRVSSCNFQVSRFTPRSRSGFQVAISKFQDSNQDPGQGFKWQFQVSRSTPRSRSEFQDAVASVCWSYRITPQCAHSEKQRTMSCTLLSLMENGNYKFLVDERTHAQKPKCQTKGVEATSRQQDNIEHVEVMRKKIVIHFADVILGGYRMVTRLQTLRLY